MKKLIYIAILAGLSLASCKKDPDPVSKTVTVSYPTITLKGSPIVHIAVNGSYTDAGATLIDDITGASSDITPTFNEIDATTPGIYAVRYIAKNTNGFETEAYRTVLVLDYTPPAGLDPNFDLSGAYLRAATGIINNVTKIDNGLYMMDNFGGSSAVYPAYFVTPDTTSISVPAQVAFGLNLDCSIELLNPGPPISFSYKVAASGFGTNTRIFEKQ